MYVRILDPYQDLFVREAIKVVIQLPVVTVKVHIELSLKQKFVCVDIIESQKSRMQSPINDQTHDSAQFHRLKLVL